MADTVITKDTLRKLLSVLSADMRLIGPVNTGKVVEFRDTCADEVLMDDAISYKSPKEYYFPQTEKLMSFTQDEALEPPEPPTTLIFGAKPCDLEALRVMQAVFMEGRYADPFFARRMDKNLIIGVGCVQKKAGCFCDELGLDMTFSDFCDIFLCPNGEGYTLERLSEKGAAALKRLDETASLSCDNARTAAQTTQSPLGLSADASDVALFDAVDWKALTMACQGCGICTYICPTCHCFEFKDTQREGSLERFRCWDSCMYPKFTLHASGHNPRAQRHERYRQRFLHKYLYVKKNTGYTSCTGCGRCIRSCPVGMNIKEVAQAAMEVKA